MKVLMLCLEFPPLNTTGNYRSAGFARHFCKSGVDTVVLTCDIQSGEKNFNKKADNSLLTGLENANIYRFTIKAIQKFWSNGIGNKLRIWWNTTDKIDRRWYYGKNKENIDSIIAKELPDIIYVSLPPFSMARTALKISKKFNIPLITDMRDAWSLWVTNPFSTRFHYQKIRNLENKLFKQSSLILGVTPELVNDFCKQHPNINSNKFKTVFNGFDSWPRNIESAASDDKSKYRIGYVGTFYYSPKSEMSMATKWYKRKGLKKFYYSPRKEQWVYRSPYFFLKSISLLLKENIELKSKVVFEYVGNCPDWLHDMIRELSLEDVFINHGFKSKNETMHLLRNWNAILATSEKVNGGDHFCLPSKLFDVIASGKQVIAFMTPGSQLNFLKEYSQVAFFDPDTTVENNNKLFNLITSNNNSGKIDQLSSEYHREVQAEKLLSLLSKL